MVWLTLPLEILSNMCIVIIFGLVCDVINFERFPTLSKKSGQNLKYFKNEKSF